MLVMEQGNAEVYRNVATALDRWGFRKVNKFLLSLIKTGHNEQEKLIIEAVAKELDVEPELITQKRSDYHDKVYWAISLVAVLFREKLSYSNTEIGNVLGGMSRSWVSERIVEFKQISPKSKVPQDGIILKAYADIEIKITKEFKKLSNARN